MDSWLRYLPGGFVREIKKMKAVLPPDEYLTKIAKGFDLAKLLKLPDEFFTKNRSIAYV